MSSRYDGNRNRHPRRIAGIVTLFLATFLCIAPTSAQDDDLEDVEVLLEETEVEVTSDSAVDWVRVYGEGIGNDIISEAGFIDAIDISSRSDVDICFPLLAWTLFLDADTDPREISGLDAELDEDEKTTCATVYENGTVVLVTPAIYTELIIKKYEEGIARWLFRFGGGLIGGVLGGAAGGLACGSAGTFVFPVVGTVSAAVICAKGGAILGAPVGSYVGDAFAVGYLDVKFRLYDAAEEFVLGDYPCTITPADYLYLRDAPWGNIVAVASPDVSVKPVGLALDEGDGLWYMVITSDEDETEYNPLFIYARWVEKKGYCT